MQQFWGSTAGSLLVAAVFAGVADAQLRLRIPDNSNPQESHSVVVMPPRELTVALETAKEQLAADQILPALNLLQFILDQPEDYFSDETLTRSLKRDVIALLSTLPEKARQSYELQNGALAAAIRDRAKTEQGELAARQLLSRYSQTTVAQEEILHRGREAFDSGQNLAAGRYWDILQGTKIYEQSPSLRLLHPLAWLRSERPDRMAAVLKEAPLPQKHPLILGEKSLTPPSDDSATLHWLLKSMPQFRPQPDLGLAMWSMFRGNPFHNASAQPAGPIGPVVWSRSLRDDFAEWAQLEGITPPAPDDFQHLLEEVVQTLQMENQLLQPGSHPLVVDGTVILRTPFFLEAVDLKTGKRRWRSTLRNTWLAQLMAEADGTNNERLQNRLSDDLQDLLLRHQTLGQLSSHNGQVFAVEPTSFKDVFDPLRMAMTDPATSSASVNRLVSYDLQGGRILWELGGARREIPFPLAGTYFLGPPLCLDDRLYCLVEGGNELRLIQLHDSGKTAGPDLEWSQVIAAPHVNLAASGMRQRAGLTPASAEGLLICSTAAGLVAAVDPIRRQLVWGYEYPSLEKLENIDPRLMALNQLQGRRVTELPDERETRWLDSAPTIASGRVLLTPRDSTDLHCLDVLTGELLWKKPRERDLYVAGVRDQRVIIVSRDQVRAVNLMTGEPAWTAPLMISEPSGRGLMLDNQYLLPLATGEILAFECDTGRPRLRSRLGQGRIPGNLVAGNGALVSQGLETVISFRPLPEIERQVETQLQMSADDPAALALRGELRLRRGDDAGAVADLRRSLQLAPNEQAGMVLVDVLLERLKKQFPDDPAQLQEIEGLIQDPQQRNEFHSLAAAGYERRGEFLSAFQQYLKLSVPGNGKFPFVRPQSDLTIRQDRMIRGHLWDLYARASETDRLKMDRELSRRLENINTGSAEDLKRFLDYFDGLPQADQARLQYLQHPSHVRNSEDQGNWLHLSRSSDPQIAAQAVAWLARSALDQGLPEHAAAWLNRLQTEYLQKEIQPGQTGATLLSRWKEDITTLQANAVHDWPSVPLEPTRLHRPPMFQRLASVEQTGPPHPVYRSWMFDLLEDSTPSLLARNAAAERQWVLPNLVQDQIPLGPRSAAPQLWTAGQFMAVSFGTGFVLCDTATPTGQPRVRWRQSLEPPASNPYQSASISVRVEFMKSGRRRIRVVDNDSDLQIGQFVGLSQEQVVFQVGSRLTAVDAMSGQVLWVRLETPPQSEGTMDERHIVLLDPLEEQAVVYRAADGELLARHAIPDPHEWVWYRGTSLLSMNHQGAQRFLQLTDLATGRARWSIPVTATTRCRVVDDREAVCLDQDGHWRVVSLQTGLESSSGTAPRLPELDYLWCQAERGGYLVVAGTFTPPGSTQQVVGYDGNQVPLTGAAFRFASAGGMPTWMVELGPTAFHVLQPVANPLLVFAGRLIQRRTTETVEVPAIPRLAAMFIDRRTGEVIYETNEVPAPGMFQIEADGDGQRVFANFLSFIIEFRPPKDPVTQEPVKK